MWTFKNQWHSRWSVVLFAVVVCVILLCICVSATATYSYIDPDEHWPSTRSDIPNDADPDIRKLIEKTFSQHPQECIDAVNGLERKGIRAAVAVPFLINLLSHWNDQEPSMSAVAVQARQCLENLGPASVPGLIKALANPQLSAIGSQIVYILGSIADSSATQSLLDHSDSGEKEYQHQVIWALGRIADPRSFEALVALLNEKDTTNTAALVSALGSIGDARAVVPIKSLLRDRIDTLQSHEKVAAIIALARLRAEDCFDMLLQIYKDSSEDPQVQCAALTALGATGGKEAFDVLRGTLVESKDLHERIAAAWGLAAIADERSIALLAEVLRNEQPDGLWFKGEYVPTMRQELARALVYTNKEEAVDAVYQELLVSKTVDEEAVERGLDDSLIDYHFRIAAVDAFAMSAEPRAYLKVIDVLNGPDMHSEVARVLYHSTPSSLLSRTDQVTNLGKSLPALRDTKVLQALMKLAADGSESDAARNDAIGALCKSRNPDAVSFVERLEEDRKE